MGLDELKQLLSPYRTKDGTYFLDEEVMTIIAMYKLPLIRKQIAQEIEVLELDRANEILEAEKHTAPEILWHEIMPNDTELKAYRKVLQAIRGK